MTTALKTACPIRISEDRLRAEIIPAGAAPDLLVGGQLLVELQDLGITINDDVTARVRELEELAKAGTCTQEPFLLAEGRPAEPGVGAQVELAAARRVFSEDERADFYESRIIMASEGEAVGTLIPGIPPRDGVDVFGQVLPGIPAAQSVEIGENIRVDTDGVTLIAAKAGKVHLTRSPITVLEVVEIKGDVDFSTGNVDSPTDVFIGGTVRDSFKVRSAKTVSVTGAIEAAKVEAASDVQVSGGVAGRNQGRVTAGGNIATKFCSEATLNAKGDITISRECLNSRVYACGTLHMARGRFVGGFAYARQGARIKVLGNDSEKPTSIAVGQDPVALEEAARLDEIINKKMGACATIREKVGPLLAQLKRLTPQQREKATELLYQADEIEDQVRLHKQAKEEVLAASLPKEKATLLVTSVVYPGVKVIFGDRMAVFRKERRGPVKIERRLVDRVEEICVID
ncbi:MAG TPA: FapA family protein, partial [Phycisphaerae bacterium]|nr:FapA family protein [Phycisphaerae bacterium]